MARKLPGQADSTLIGAFQCHLGFHRSPIPIIHLDNINIVGMIMISSDIFDKIPGIVPCLLEPSAEQFHPFPQAPPVVSVVVSIKHSFDRKFHLSLLTKLPLADTMDPKCRSLCVPDVSVQELISGLYLSGC